MKVTIVFPPQASPTYAPLGVSTLKAYVTAQLPDAELQVVDLNLQLWQQLAAQSPQRQAWAAFVKTDEPAFFQAMPYRQQLPAAAEISTQIRRLTENARHYLETGETDATVQGVLEQWLALLQTADPHCLAFSVMFLDQLILALALASAWAAQARGQKAGRPLIVFGGAAVSTLNISELLQAFPFIDAVIAGEGEQALLELCRQGQLTDLPGTVMLADGNVTRKPPAAPLCLDTLPAPDFSGQSPRTYFNPLPVLPVVMSRGCPWRKCRFCAHNFTFGTFRARSPGHTVDMLEQLQNDWQVRHFYFADQYITGPMLESISDEILRRRFFCRFHIMAKPGNEYPPPLLQKAAAAGCCWISWGMETGSQRLLDLVRKGANVQDAETCMKAAHQAGISNLPMMIFGLPTTTAADFEATFAFLSRIQPYSDAVTASSFVLFSGTAFARQAAAYDLDILGPQPLLNTSRGPVHTNRLRFKRRGEAGCQPSLVGRREVDLWESRRLWLGEPSFLESLPCEHYLLHAAARQDISIRPPLPFDPFGQPPSTTPLRRTG